MSVEKERLIILERGTYISPFRADRILYGMLKRLEDLPRFREDIQLITSIESVGEKEKLSFPHDFLERAKST